MAGGKAVGDVLAAQAAFDVEQSIEPLHGLERDRIDLPSPLAAALLASSTLDIG
jgi:hypothetical protein